MTNPTCATCRFFGGGNRCHRSPPVWIAAGDHVQPGWWQPTTDVGGWCGEHAPAEPVGVPQLPKGWAWGSTPTDDHTTAVHSFGAVTVRGEPGAEIINITGHIRLDVVETTIAAHRARGVR